MDEKEVFGFLKARPKPALLDLLKAAFREMNGQQRRAVFTEDVVNPKKEKKTPRIDEVKLLREIKHFHSDSLAGRYYAPFDVNSKNFMDIPEETDDWCDRFAGFVKKAGTLTAIGHHKQAVACHALLYELFNALDMGKEIIFVEEAGSWMIPIDKKAWIKAYLTSLAATSTPEAFAAAVIPMIKSDSFNSFANKVRSSALKVADPQQKALLRAEIQRAKIRIH